MGEIIAVVNQKGGVGKTTTAMNLAACLAAAEHHSLVVDLDPQGNATSGLGITGDEGRDSYAVILGECPWKEALAASEVPNLSVIPATKSLAGANVELVSEIARELKLKDALAGVRDEFEFVFLDCPPSLELLTINAMAAADSLLVPLQCEYFALEGLGHLLETQKLVRKSVNKTLNLEGIVLTMYDTRNRLSSEIESEVRQHFPQAVYRTVIPRNVRLSEAPSHGKPIIAYDITCRGAEAYMGLASEFLDRRGLSGGHRKAGAGGRP
ncbi:MAG: ParA family protein [Deltaproteobacteria bacterium]|nr:ParA family protein [Deltaproteobacteria bacterium]